MKLHRLYVGLKDDEGNTYDVLDVSRIVSRYLNSFTIIPCQGHEFGMPEPSCIVEVIAKYYTNLEAIVYIMGEIKREMNQREVLHIIMNINE